MAAPATCLRETEPRTQQMLKQRKPGTGWVERASPRDQERTESLRWGPVGEEVFIRGIGLNGFSVPTKLLSEGRCEPVGEANE